MTAQLIDAASGAHLWAERYDRALDDIFAVQDEVVATIAATLAGRIEAARSGACANASRPTDLVAYDLRSARAASASPPMAPSSQCRGARACSSAP